MATTAPETTTSLQELAQRHLWLHFSRMGGYGPDHEIPIIARGDGCYVWDDHGKRYLDALSALFCVNIGHGRHDVAQAGADQARELGFFTNWSYAHPPAIELAARHRQAAADDEQACSTLDNRATHAALPKANRRDSVVQSDQRRDGLEKRKHGNDRDRDAD